MHAKRLLIAGAGIAGLSLAIALRRRGIATEIVERTTQWGGDGAGMYLIGLATRALQELGLADAAIRDGQIVRTQRLFDHGGDFLAVSDVDSFWTSCGPCFGASRANIHQLLAGEAQGVPIRFGVGVTAIEQHANHVEVRCSDGSSAKYDLLVGADGIHSSVRRLELGSDASTFRGQMGWRFIAPLPSGIDGWSVFLGRGRTFLFVPIGGGKAYCYADQSVAQPLRESARHLDRIPPPPWPAESRWRWKTHSCSPTSSRKAGPPRTSCRNSFGVARRESIGSAVKPIVATACGSSHR
jgi:2-polyprenyl-6-methoxyphenol hydroxylase-like FAD-dependent oxidoreductase